MAVYPYFVISPNTVVSLIGLLKGPDKIEPAPKLDSNNKTVDVLIPTYNEEKNIVFCLASLLNQTKRPRKVYIIDDGSHDNTIDYANKFCEANLMDIEILQRRESIGKTPALKSSSRTLDCDVLFILDGDTLLESENYIERISDKLFETPAKGIACVCGTIVPLWNRFRKQVYEYPSVQRFLTQFPDAKFDPSEKRMESFLRNITNAYRGALYTYLQRFIYRGQMAVFGTIINPVGCAVGYRREYLQELFDEYEDQLGDDLTNSEDIFIGMAMSDNGFRNVQLNDIYAKTEEPLIHRLPFQVYKWSSAYLQSCYYFRSLMISPIRSYKRFRKKKKDAEYEELRKIKEPYRQPFGRSYTSKLGRPIGWSIISAVIEKVFFPIIFLVMIILQWWEALIVTIVAETALSLIVLFIVAKGERIKYVLMGFITTPIRYFVMVFDLFVLGRFATDVVLFRGKGWRK